MSFWRKTSQSLSAEASSTTICLLSSDSLKTMYLYFLDNFRSLYAVMHSCETEALMTTAWLACEPQCDETPSPNDIPTARVSGHDGDDDYDTTRGATNPD